MIILDSALKTLELVLSGVVATNELPFVSNYVTLNPTTFNAVEQDGLSNGVTPVTIVSAPGVGLQTQVKFISIYNADTAEVTVTINYNNNATLRAIVTVTLGVGYTLQYTDGDGWSVLDATGAFTTFASTGAAITDLTGDVTAVGPGSAVATIAANVVTNAKLADVNTQTIKGRTTAGAGDPEDLTATQATAILDNFVGDSGAGGVKGLVPAPAAGDAAAGKFLKADGTFQIPPDTNTGITELTGDVTAGPGSGSQVATIPNDTVTYAKIQNVSATDRLLGRDTAGAGDIEELTATGGIEFTGTGIQTSAFTGDVTKAAGGTALTIANDAVTFAKMQNIATDRLLGRETAGSGDVEEIALGGGLELASTTLRQGVIIFLNAGVITGHSPLDSTTYRFSAQPGINPPAAADPAYAAFATRAGTVKRAYGNFVVGGVAASAENVTVRVRNGSAGTNENITTALQMTAVSNPFNNTALTLAFSAGDNILCEFVTPAWATNPTGVFYNLTLELQYN